MGKREAKEEFLKKDKRRQTDDKEGITEEYSRVFVFYVSRDRLRAWGMLRVGRG